MCDLQEAVVNRKLHGLRECQLSFILYLKFANFRVIFQYGREHYSSPKNTFFLFCRYLLKKKPIAPFPPLCFNINAKPPDGQLYYFAYGAEMNPNR